MLYCFAMAHQMLGNVDLAGDDLQSALGVELGNAPMRKKFALVRRAVGSMMQWGGHPC